MAIRPSGMTDEEYKRLTATAPGAQAGAAVGQSLRTAGNFGRALASDIARPSVQAFNATFGALDRGVQAANNFVSSAVAGRPVSSPINKPPMLAAPRPGATAAPAAIASPGAGTKPRNAAELNQASQAETAARNQAPPPGASAGAGASTTAGVGAPITKSIGKFGETVYSNVASPATTPATAGTMGTVNTQNFGNPVVPQAPGSIARPGVASTFGLGVNDPRMNDAIARPQVQLGPNQTNGFGTLRGPDAMAEQYNSREDREARQKVSGDIDTALFLARGKPGSEAVMANLLQTKASLNSGAEGLSQEAIQNRENRGNAYGIADLNNAGENNRAGIQADVARAGQQVVREGQQLSYQSSMADIARPQLKQDANGNYINIAGNTSTTVTDAQGNPVRGAQTEQAQQRDYGQENDNKMFTDLLATKIDQIGNPLPNAVDLAMADMQKYKAAQNQQTAQSASTAPTLDAYVKAARAAGYKQSDAELAAAFQKKYPQAK